MSSLGWHPGMGPYQPPRPNTIPPKDEEEELPVDKVYEYRVERLVWAGYSEAMARSLADWPEVVDLHKAIDMVKVEGVEPYAAFCYFYRQYQHTSDVEEWQTPSES